MTTFNVNSLTAIAPITTPATAGAISYGALGYLDANVMLSLQSSANTYVQAVIQNTNAGTAASADLVISNNLGTSSAYFINLGMNSSTYTGSGSYNLPNAGYVTSTSGDLVIGTTTNNAIHFIVNGGTTDAMTITGAGQIDFGGGAAGSFLYQTAPGITAYLPIGPNTYVLQSNGTAPVWTASNVYNPSSVAITGGSINNTAIGNTTPSTGVFTSLTSSGSITGSSFTGAGTNLTGTATALTIGGGAATALSIGGGLANQITYQISPSTTGFIAAPTVSSTYLAWNGSNFVWQASTAYSPSSVAITGGSITGTSISVADTAFTITNLADPTKKVTFSASGVTTGTTSNITVPGVSGTLAILNAAQTFTATQNVNAAFNTTGTTALATGTGGVTTIGSSAVASTTTIGGGATTSTISLNGITTATGVLNAPNGIVSPSVAGKNVLINGDMSISQINGGVAVTPTASVYVIDQWIPSLLQPSKLTFQQVTNKLNSLGATFAELITTASAYTAASSDYFLIQQYIEGNNFSRFFYGTANSKAASLQFKANASVAGTYSGSIANAANTRSYVFTFVLAANIDTLVTIQNIPGDTSGTWVGASSAASIQLRFDLGSGSTFRSSTINAWQAGNIVGATGSVSLVATAGATLAISEVQFELGPVCTAYERKLVSQSLAECQRYYQTGLILSQAIAQSYIGGSVMFPVVMRASPSVIFSDSVGNVNRFTNSTTNNLTVSAGGITANTYSLYLNAISSTTLLGNTYWYINWTADARL